LCGPASVGDSALVAVCCLGLELPRLNAESPGKAARRCLRAVLTTACERSEQTGREPEGRVRRTSLAKRGRNSSPMSPRCRRKTLKSYRALCGSKLRLRLEAARPVRAARTILRQDKFDTVPKHVSYTEAFGASTNMGAALPPLAATARTSWM